MCQSLRHFFAPIHPSYIFYSSLCGIIIGIVLSLFLGNAVCAHFLWLVVAILTIGFCLHFAHVTCLVLACVAGMLIGNWRLGPELQSQTILTNLAGETVTVKGRISTDPEIVASQAKFYLTNLELVGAENITLAGTIYVQLVGANLDLERSDAITLSGKLGAGFGIFAGSLYRPEIVDLSRATTGDIFARLKLWFAGAVKNYIPAPEADLGLGYLVGLKSGLPDTLAETLRTVGMTHVIVASGAHLGILVSAAKKIFGRLSKFAGVLFSLLLIMGFVLVVGFTPSMTRAALVSSLTLLFGYVGRKFVPLNLLILVATLTLLIAPFNCLNLGWQLSFASFFALLIVAPCLQKFFYARKQPPWLAGMLLTSLATTLTCAPILIYNFGTLSLLSFVANLFILPTLPYAMLLVFLTGSFSFCPWVASIMGRVATLLLDSHIWLINFLGEKKMFIFELSAGDVRIFLLYLPLLLLLLWSYLWQNFRCLRKSTGTSQPAANIV